MNIKKKLAGMALVGGMMVSCAAPAMAAVITAVPNASPVALDGQVREIAAYTIDGNNYFKLRDVAALLNGTGANFEVGFDAAANAISLTTKEKYTAIGDELQNTKPKGNKAALSSGQSIALNGSAVSMKAYEIDGYNYFQLRDLGEKLGFAVVWDESLKSINIVTTGTATEKDETDKATSSNKVVQNKEQEFTAENMIASATDLGNRMLIYADNHDYANFANLFHSVSDDSIKTFYNQMVEYTDTYDKVEVVPVKAQGVNIMLSVNMYAVSGTFPHSSYKSQSFLLPMSYKDNMFLLDLSNAAQQALANGEYLFDVPEGMQAARNMGRNSTVFDSSNYMHTMARCFEGALVNELKYAWQNSDGSVSISVWFANGTGRDVVYTKFKSLSLKDDKLGFIVLLQNSSVSLSVSNGASGLYTWTIPADEVKTAFADWSSISADVNMSYKY